MKTRVGFRAARSLAVEGRRIVSAAIVGNNLVLTKFDGTTVNAGNVRGLKGDTGDPSPTLPGPVNFAGTDVTGILPVSHLPVATSGIPSNTQVVRADDSTLSDNRVPTAHTHAATDLTTGTINVARVDTAVGSASNVTQVVRADDPRVADSGWLTPSFQNSWGNYDARTANYRKIGKEVFMRGYVYGGPQDTVMFTLPIGYRPQNFSVGDALMFLTLMQIGAKPVTINSDGGVHSFAAGAPTGWISLNGIQYTADG